MALSNLPERVATLETIPGQGLVMLREIVNRQRQIVWVVVQWHHLFGLLEAALPFGR